MFKQFLGLACVSIISSPTAYCLTVDFNNSNDLGSFSVTSLNPGPTLTPILAGGVADSGALDVDAVGSNVTGTWTENSYDFSDIGKILQTSVFFRFQDFSLPPNNGRDFIAVGFFPNNSSLYFLSDMFGVVLNSNNNGNVAFYSRSGSHGTGEPPVTNFLTDDNWYQLVGEFENLGSEIAYTGKLNDFGADGTQFQGEIWSLSQTMNASASILSDDSVWPGFTASSEGGTDNIDNFAFASVPEPTTISLLLSGLFISLFTRNRKSTVIKLGYGVRRDLFLLKI